MVDFGGGAEITCPLPRTLLNVFAVFQKKMDPKQVRAPWDWAPKILDPCEILQNIYEFNETCTVKQNTLYKDDAVVYSFCGQLV